MKKLLLLTLFLGSLFQLQAQGTIRGLVVDGDGEPLPYATVLLFTEPDSVFTKAAYTDDNGLFELAPISAGQYQVQVSLSGMETFRETGLKLAENQTLEVKNIVLTTAEAELDAVQITAEKPIVTVRPDMTIFNVEGTINAIGEDAFNLLRKAPGVVIDNNDNIMVLGKSGVRVYIDGKPSPLSASDLASLLKSMQSSEIEAIEIITNPSAKYDAEGNAGIINIKLKKDRSIGANGNLSLGYAIGRFSKYNGSLSFNYRNKKFNAFGSYSAFTGRSWNYMNFYRVQNGRFFDQNTDMYSDNFNQNFKGGMDFFLNDKHTLGFMVNGFIGERDGQNVSETRIGDVGSEIVDSILVANTLIDRNSSNLNGNLNYRFDDGKGQSLNIDADYGRFRFTADSWQPNTYLTADENNTLSERNFRSITPTLIDIYTFKVDYERNLLGGQLGTGAKVSWVSTDNTFAFYDVVNGNENLNTDRSNNFVYTENVNAAYATWNRTIKKIGVNAGLRVEQTNSLGELSSTQNTGLDRVERHYLSFFPSGGLTYNPSQKHSLRLNYSRRIDRPRYQDLNPFEFKLDELSYQRGNPFLQPQFTHSMQLTHTFNYAISTTLSYSITNDYFTDINDTTETSRSFITKENLAKREVVSLNLSAPYSPTKWLSLYTNLTLYRASNSADFGEGKVIDVARTTFSVFHQQTYKLPKDFSIQASVFYNSPSIWGANYLNESIYGVEAGLQKKVFKGKGNLRLSVTDIFWGMRWAATSQFGGLDIRADGGWESRQFKANFTWNFGNQEVKKSRKRKTGLEDEKGRAGNGG